MKYLLPILLTLLFSACGSHQDDMTSEQLNIESCIEDYMDSAYYPTDMDDMNAIDYIANEARAHCDALYGG